MKIKKIKDCNETLSNCSKGIAYCVSEYYKKPSKTMRRNLEINILNNLDHMECLIRQMKKEMEEISERENKIFLNKMDEAREILKNMNMFELMKGN